MYVDDLIMVMKDAKGLFDKLMSLKIGSTMKGVGKPTYHLGADFFCDNDGALSLGSKTYSKCLCSSFLSLYGEEPKHIFEQLHPEDHPELDNSPLCGPDDITKYQSLIGACQCMISFCRFDIAQAIMSLSQFHHCP